jgi:predicted phosphodiesterase
MARVLAGPDKHAPFMHQDAVNFLGAVADEYDIDTYVDLGDLIDNHAMSDYDVDPDGYAAGDEYLKAMEQLQDLYDLFPDAKACYGNHDIRVHKKAHKAGIPKGFLRDFSDIIQSPVGWEWADEHIIDGIMYTHGTGYSGVYATRHMMMHKMSSVVHGHTHAYAGVMHMQINFKDSIFGMNAGCLQAQNTYATDYAKYYRMRPSIGAGIVLDGIPFWIPMLMNKSGKRWNGNIV